MITVARVIYHLFVKAFDITNRSLVIEYIDGNKLNCFCKNLALTDYSAFVKKGYDNGARRSQFHENIRPVSQYDLQGNFIKTYASAKVAAAATDIPYRYINHAACSETRASGGFYWKYGKRKK